MMLFLEEYDMSDSVEIGIIDNFDRKYDYSIADSDLEYEEIIKKYKCVSISDDIFNKIIPQLADMDTYFQNYGNPHKGLDHYGETIIPPESLHEFIDAIKSAGILTNEVGSLLILAETAYSQGKYMICFGV